MASSRKFNVPGAVNVRLSGLTGLSGLQDIGWTEDGVEVTEREFTIECKTDRYGGVQGPAADVQSLGMEAELRFTVTEFNTEFLMYLRSRFPGNATIGANPGRIITPGTLKFANGGLVRCLLQGALDTAAIAASVAVAELATPLNYPFCEIVDAVSFNLGTRHQKLQFVLKARQGVVSSNVVLWNRDNT
jgi:hypothetical protein